MFIGSLRGALRIIQNLNEVQSLHRGILYVVTTEKIWMKFYIISRIKHTGHFLSRKINGSRVIYSGPGISWFNENSTKCYLPNKEYPQKSRKQSQVNLKKFVVVNNTE